VKDFSLSIDVIVFFSREIERSQQNQGAEIGLAERRVVSKASSIVLKHSLSFHAQYSAI